MLKKYQEDPYFFDYVYGFVLFLLEPLIYSLRIRKVSELVTYRKNLLIEKFFLINSL